MPVIQALYCASFVLGCSEHARTSQPKMDVSARCLKARGHLHAHEIDVVMCWASRTQADDFVGQICHSDIQSTWETDNA